MVNISGCSISSIYGSQLYAVSNVTSVHYFSNGYSEGPCPGIVTPIIPHAGETIIKHVKASSKLRRAGERYLDL